MRKNKIVYPLLKKRMKEKKIYIKDLASKVRIRNDVLSRKLRGVTSLSLEEALSIHECFEDEKVEELFKKKNWQ